MFIPAATVHMKKSFTNHLFNITQLDYELEISIMHRNQEQII